MHREQQKHQLTINVLKWETLEQIFYFLYYLFIFIRTQVRAAQEMLWEKVHSYGGAVWKNYFTKDWYTLVHELNIWLVLQAHLFHVSCLLRTMKRRNAFPIILFTRHSPNIFSLFSMGDFSLQSSILLFAGHSKWSLNIWWKI